MMRRMIFALRVFGRSSRNFKISGLRGLPICSATMPRNSSRSFSLPWLSGLRTQKQTSASPLIGSGTPIAAASLTEGWPTSTDSTSAGPSRFPAILIVSSERPRMYQRPSSSTAAQSPWTQTSENRQAAPSGGVEKPEPRIRIPGLSRGAENAQGRKVMLLCGSAAVTHETANQSRRDAENTHPMALDERPQTIRPRKIQSSLVKNHRRAEKGCTKNFPRPHHPSHVRHPVKHVLLSDIEAKQHVLRGLDRKTAVRVKRPFRPSGRSRGVNDHQRIFSVGPFRFRLIALLPDLFMPPPVATPSPRNRNPNPPKNEHTHDRRR